MFVSGGRHLVDIIMNISQGTCDAVVIVVHKPSQ